MSKGLARLQDFEAAVQKTEQDAAAAASRYRPLWNALRAVREATPADLGVTGSAFYRVWADMFCRAGTELAIAGLLAWLAGRATKADPAEALAVEIYQLGVKGKIEEIVELLTKTFCLSEADSDNQMTIASRGAVNAWLRVRLADKLRESLSHQQETGTIPVPQPALGKSREPVRRPDGAGPAADPPAPKSPLVSKISLAIAIRTEHPDWSDIDVARHAGCNPKTLCRSNKYRSFRDALRDAGRRSLPKGRKGKDGKMEAWENDE